MNSRIELIAQNLELSRKVVYLELNQDSKVEEMISNLHTTHIDLVELRNALKSLRFRVSVIQDIFLRSPEELLQWKTQFTEELLEVIVSGNKISSKLSRLDTHARSIRSMIWSATPVNHYYRMIWWPPMGAFVKKIVKQQMLHMQIMDKK